MKLLLIREGKIDDVLLPPLMTVIASANNIPFPLDFRQDILTDYQKHEGFGGVVTAVERVLDALRKDRNAVYRYFRKVVVLLDGKGTPEAQAQIQGMISSEPDFFLGVAIKEIEAWVLADREHVLQWLGTNSRACPDCRYWDPGYRPERDPDPKETLDRLVRHSVKTEYDGWCTGAAEEFIELYWKGTNYEGDYVNVTNWPGRANLVLMQAGCPQGFEPFYRGLIQFIR